MRADSDLKLLIVKRGDHRHLEPTGQIYGSLGYRAYDLDITVATPEEVEKYSDEHCLVLYPHAWRAAGVI